MRQPTRHITSIPVLLISILALVLVYFSTERTVNADDYLYLSDGWTVWENGSVIEHVNLSTAVLSQKSKGDTVVLTLTLPDQQISHPVLRFYSVHSAITVQLNGKVLYTYGQDLLEENKILGFGYQFVSLPDSYAGQILRIQFDVSENNAFSAIDVPAICNADTMIRDFSNENRLPLAISLFLIVFGVCLLIVCLFFASNNMNIQFFKLACIALFSSSIGVWSLCSYDLILLFTYVPTAKTYLEFISLYTCPLFVILYFIDSVATRRNRIFRILYYCLVTAQSLFIVVALFLQFTNILHLPAMLKFQHVLFVPLIALIVLHSLLDLLSHQVRSNALVAGSIIMLLVGGFDLVNFNIQKYIPYFQHSHYISHLCVGTLIFVCALFIDFCQYVSDGISSMVRSQLLEDMAYTDVLTGIANRRKCEEMMEIMDKDSSCYSLISLDLNNLKLVNDTQGHAAGDRLIQTFAKVLDDVFGKRGTVGRMGGDEFLVILPDITEKEQQPLIDELLAKINQTNRDIPELHLSTAYGFCAKTENPNWNVNEIYHEADSRMYENKIKSGNHR